MYVVAGAALFIIGFQVIAFNGARYAFTYLLIYIYTWVRADGMVAISA